MDDEIKEEQPPTLPHDDLEERSDGKTLVSSMSHDSIYSLGNAHRRTTSEIPISLSRDVSMDLNNVVAVSPEKKIRRKSLLKKSVSQEVLNSEEGTQSHLRAKKTTRISKSVSFHDQVELVEINETEVEDIPTPQRSVSPTRHHSTKRFVSLSQDFGEYDFDREDAKFRAAQELASPIDPAKISAIFNFAWLITIICVIIAVIIVTIAVIIALVVLGNKCAAPLSSKYTTVEKHSFPYFFTSDSSNLIDHLIIQTTGDIRFFFDAPVNTSSTILIDVDVTHFAITQKKLSYKISNVVYTRENKTLGIIITERYDLLAGLEGIWGGNLCSGSNVDVHLPAIMNAKFKSVNVYSTMKGQVYINLNSPILTSETMTTIGKATLSASLGDIQFSAVRITNNLSIISLPSAINITNVIASGNLTVQSETQPIYISDLGTSGLLNVNVINKFDSIYVSTHVNISGLTLTAASAFSGVVTMQFDASILCAETSFEVTNSVFSTKKVIINNLVPSSFVIMSVDQDHEKAGFVQSRNCANGGTSAPNYLTISGYNDVIMNVLA
jgi:hypothetical protein